MISIEVYNSCSAAPEVCNETEIVCVQYNDRIVHRR